MGCNIIESLVAGNYNDVEEYENVHLKAFSTISEIAKLFEKCDY